MGRSITRLRDIADKTGFSTNTVSLALRDSPRIPESTRQVIRRAAEELNYLPNQIAKSLVSRETRTIGLVLTHITNPILTLTAQGIELALAERGYGTMFATSNNTLEEEKKVLEMLRSRQVDGMLIYPASHRELDHIRALRRTGYPVVILVGDPDAGVDAVSMDDRRGAYKATRHLIGLGHRDIAIIDAAHTRGNFEKLEGYQRALTEAGITFDPALLFDPQGHTGKKGYEAMARLMRSAPGVTAVFVGNDSLAIGALSWCRENGIDIPGDMSVFGFDNIEFSGYAATPLSTVDYAAGKISGLAVERLMQIISAGDELPEPEITLIDPELVIRESAGPVRRTALRDE